MILVFCAIKNANVQLWSWMFLPVFYKIQQDLSSPFYQEQKSGMILEKNLTRPCKIFKFYIK